MKAKRLKAGEVPCQDCNKRAIYIARVTIPPVGGAVRNGFQEAEFISGKPLCFKHYLAATAKRFLNDQVRDGVAAFYGAQGLRPDFDAAVKTAVRIGSTEYQNYLIRMGANGMPVAVERAS